MGFFKKIFKGIGKVFKKIGKGIKSAFKKVGKWMGKLGIFGQIAMSFIPGLNIFGSLFSKLGGRALSLLSKGLAGAGQKGLLGSIVKGASWMLDTPRKILGGITKGFKTVTSAATSFVSNSTKFIGQKMGLTTTGPTSFFGTGGDSVLGRVGAEVTENFKSFQDTVAGTFSGVEGRAAALDKQLNVTRIGGVEIDNRDNRLDKLKGTQDFSAAEKPEFLSRVPEDAIETIEFTQADQLVVDVGEGIKNTLGQSASDNFNSLRTNGGYANSVEFLKEVQAKPGFVNEFINSSQKQRDQFFKFKQNETDITNPFEKSFFKMPDFSTLPGDIVKSSVVSAGTQAVLGGQSDFEPPTRQAFNIQNVPAPSLLSMPGQSDVAGLSGSGAAYGLASSIDPYAFLSPIYSGMNMEGMSQGQFGLPGPQSFQPRMIS